MYGFLPYIIGEAAIIYPASMFSKRCLMAISRSPKISKRSKSERLEARVTPQQKELLQYAAELQGLSLTDFLVTSAQRIAEAAIREHNVITLTKRDSMAFAEALLNPRQPNADLRAAFARYSQEVESGD
jgi:uncharacterized protein (DUF1778 family)